MERLFTVKEICDKYGITRKTLFYYDKIGLVSPRGRVGSQMHKVYYEADIRKLKAVLIYRNAGLTIEEIKEITKLTKEIIDCMGILEKARKRLLKDKSRKEQELKKLDALIAKYEKEESGRE